MNLLLGMRRGDGVDLLDDDLLEEFLDLGVGLLMLGPGHQAAVIEAMQQVIDRLPAQADAEFLLQDAAQVLAAEGADAILGGGPGLEAVSEPRHIRRGQAGPASGVGPLLEGRQAPLVVAADPGLNGAVRASQSPGDRGGRMALLGQHDGLMTQPDPFLREGFGQSLKFFEAVMVLDKHRSSSWCDSDAQSILPNRHNPWNRSARIFRTWYKSGESFTGSAFCKARQRLLLGVFQRLLRRLADTLLPHSGSAHVDDEGRWFGHRIFIMDGSSGSMPDTDELQQHFGQPGNQLPGCGFPVAHLMVLFHAGTGLLREILASPLRTHDMSR